MYMFEGDWWQHMEHVGLHFQQMSSFSLVEPAQQQGRQHDPPETIKQPMTLGLPQKGTNVGTCI